MGVLELAGRSTLLLLLLLALLSGSSAISVDAPGVGAPSVGATSLTTAVAVGAAMTDGGCAAAAGMTVG